MTEVCDCGFEAANGAGLAAHQRHCDYENESGESDESFEKPTSVSTAVADAVFERDDEICVRCESTDCLTIHRYNKDKETIPSNLVTVCGECDDLLTGSHPVSKRTMVSR